MLKRLGIRAKLAVVLFIPILLIAAVAVFGVVRAVQLSRAAEGAAGVVQDSNGPLAIAGLVEKERAAVYALLRGAGAEAEEIVEVQRQLDELVTRAEGDIAGASDTARRAFTPALEYYRGPLDTLRTALASGTGDADGAWATYTRQTALALDGLSEAGSALDSTDLRTEYEILEDLARIREAVSAIHGIARVGTAGEGPLRPSEVVALLDARSRRDTWTRVLSTTAAELSPELEQVITEADRAELDAFVLAAIAGDSAVPGATVEVGAAQIDGLDQLLEQQARKVDQTANSLLTDAANQRNLLFFGAATAVLLAVGLLLLVGASVSRPLHELARDAEHMALDGLPQAVNEILNTPAGRDIEIPPVDPISSPAGDEIGEVARALDEVHRSALGLAAEQAQLRRSIADAFVNLARRTQSLVGRQLEFISTLEANETDPTTLANLFELDHLATRMRRNAESLLLLAGVEPARVWSEPIDVADVIRGALSEVEDYQRVRLARIDPGVVVGTQVADLSHLVAELLENALEFSPPEATVTVEARRVRDDYRIAIVDRGIGMSVPDLDRANRRLSGGEPLTVVPSRFLGHYVAGRLAQRIGAEVRVESSPSGGLVAMIRLPLELVAEPVEALVPAPEAPGLPTAEFPVGSPPAEPGPIETERVAVATSTSDGDPQPGKVPIVEVQGPSTPAPAAISGVDDLPTAAEPAVSGETVPAGPEDRLQAGGTSALARTSGGLVRRLPGANFPVDAADSSEIAVELDGAEPVARDARAVAQLLSGFRSGVEKGRRSTRHDENGEG